jgi:hypothetical protein
VDSFEGSEHIIDQFWERTDTGGRDIADLSLFKTGEEFFVVGPPGMLLSSPGAVSFADYILQVVRSKGGPSKQRTSLLRLLRRRGRQVLLPRPNRLRESGGAVCLV